MPTIAAEDLRNEMLHMQRTGRRHEFLLRADQYLGVVPEDHEIRLLAVREFLNLGLILSARETLEAGTGQPGAPAEFQGVLSSLGRITSRDNNWNEHRETYEKNLEALRLRGVDVDRIASSWQENAHRFRLQRDASAKYYIQLSDNDGTWRWLPHFGDMEAMEKARTLPDDIKLNQPGPYAFDGIGFGYFFERIYQATRHSFLGYSCPLFVAETDPTMLALPLHLNDWSVLLSDERLKIFTGADAVAQLVACLDTNDCLPIPMTVFRLSPFRKLRDETLSADAGLHEAIEAFPARKNTEIVESYEDVCKLYAEKNAAYWAKRFRSALDRTGAPLKVMSIVSRHTSFLKHSLSDIKEALHTLGHECRILTEDSDYECISPVRQHDAIRAFQPDVFLLLDHLRGELQMILPHNLPLMTWDQDHLPQVFVSKNIEQIAPIDFIAGFAIAPCAKAGIPSTQLLPAIIPTCPKRFDSSSLSREECKPYECDVSFVSHASQTPLDFHEEERSRHKGPHIKRLLDTLYELLPNALARDVGPHGALGRTVLREAMQRCDIDRIDGDMRQRLLNWYIWRLGDRIFRHEALTWAAEWARSRERTLRIYGNGWEQHPTLGEFAAGPAENGRELMTIYKASRINLQLMPAGFIHQRALEGLAADGFFLTRMTHADAIAIPLGRLAAIISRKNYRTNSDLLDDDDTQVQQCLTDYLGTYREIVDRNSDDLLVEIPTAAAVPRAPHAFKNFAEIAFDSPESFANKADRFCNMPEQRKQLTGEFRETVISEFSYESTMRRFLEAHTRSLELNAEV